MRKVKKRSIGIAMTAVLLLLALTVRMDVAYGAIGIDTTRKCSITFDLSSVENLVFLNESGGYEEQEPDAGVNSGETAEQPPLTQISPGFEELLKLKIEVDVYKVADVNVSGKYTEPTEGAVSVSKELYSVLEESLGKVSSQTTADDWLSMAELAMTELGKEIPDAGEAPKPTAHTTLNAPSAGGGMSIKDLSTGLYLVVAHDVKSTQYVYSFTPYLVSLPGNNYGQDEASDDWLYDVDVSLKPSREPLYGDLEIKKTFKTFNSTLGGATCVFRIEAEKDGIIYSDVKSIVFDAAGTKSIVIAEKIPAGAVVTVTEVYSGSSYEITSASEQTGTIIADQMETVEFTNDYNDRLNGGTSVVNHFTDKAAGDTNPDNTDSDNTNPENRKPVWEGEQLKDSNAEPQNPKGGTAADEE